MPPSIYYERKLYAFLRALDSASPTQEWLSQLKCWNADTLTALERWWDADREERASEPNLIQSIAASSDRVNLKSHSSSSNSIQSCHPISGQKQDLQQQTPNFEEIDISPIRDEQDPKKVFWWFWRFSPELLSHRYPDVLLYPAHKVLPDCPLHSYHSTVSALVGGLSNDEVEQPEDKIPYLLLFSFSPVQEFIKASRKFLDFWAGSYLLHYLSARLCWCIAEDYGPDAVIVPSLWGQDIVDAFIVKDSYEDFATLMEALGDGHTPASRFEQRITNNLGTAGFPNTITALVPGKANAIALGKKLKKTLNDTWEEIAVKVREKIKSQVMEYLSDRSVEAWELPRELFSEAEQDVYTRELEQLLQPGCWEWNKLWDAQIQNTWQPYFVAVPLGNPEGQSQPLSAASSDQDWITAQNAIAQPRIELPTRAEQEAYATLNAGTWWGSLQARLGQSMQAVKNTRCWQIPTAPGERSSLSGQFSAVHPRLHYADRFKTGAGMRAGSMRLFWKIMSMAYPGLFDGSEKLNALELTKRMAWIYGNVADDLGIQVARTKITTESSRQDRKERRQEKGVKLERSIQLLYERFLRFPNLSSIAAARFIHDYPSKARDYWSHLDKAIQSNLREHRRAYRLLTRIRPTNLPKTDRKVNPRGYANQNFNHRNLNGVMFSSKWLLQDMGLDKQDAATLRGLVNTAHQKLGFSDSSPSDWWVLVLADGDGMGQYVNGHKLKPYSEYLARNEDGQYCVDHNGIGEQDWKELLSMKKRMGPATHVGLNRALLDFSNRLVPYLTEHRYCGRVIYSGGDDVLVALPLADLPGFLRSLRAAWSGGQDPGGDDNGDRFVEQGEYWVPPDPPPSITPDKHIMRHLPKRPLFTMGQGATMSMGIVIAHKSVPLPTMLENLWDAEAEQAKKLLGGRPANFKPAIPSKDGLCFRIIYGSGNTLEALMKGHLLELWWEMIRFHDQAKVDLSPVFNRLAEELPKHVAITKEHKLCCQAAKAILLRREDQLPEQVQRAILSWLSEWETWAWAAQQTARQKKEKAKGAESEDLAALLKFTAFWVSRRRQELSWVDGLQDSMPVVPEVSHA